MWPSWLCGLQPIDAQDLALSRSGTPHNHLLTDSKRLGVAGARGVATTNMDAGVDRQIPAKSWANPRSRWLSQRPFRERRTRACYASVGPWNPMLMWRSAGVPFEGTGGCSGQRHITGLATLSPQARQREWGVTTQHDTPTFLCSPLSILLAASQE